VSYHILSLVFVGFSATSYVLGMIRSRIELGAAIFASVPVDNRNSFPIKMTTTTPGPKRVIGSCAERAWPISCPGGKQAGAFVISRRERVK
jgi:hypothetical protein